MATKNSDSDNSTSITVNAGEIVKAHSTLMAKMDLNHK